MKYFVIFLVLVGFAGMFFPYAYASENIIEGTSSIERIPSQIVPENPQIIEIVIV